MLAKHLAPGPMFGPDLRDWVRRCESLLSREVREIDPLLWMKVSAGLSFGVV